MVPRNGLAVFLLTCFKTRRSIKLVYSFKVVVILGLILITLFYYFGVLLNHLGVPIPSAVLGLLLIFFALIFKVIPLKLVDNTAQFMVKHMTLLFIPLLVVLPKISGRLKSDGVALLISVLISYLIVSLVTGILGEYLLVDKKGEK